MKTKVIAHVDMDAFFASVEQRDDPSLKGKPVVIGADPKEGHGRGVVSTCSYEARKFGIHSAQPISKAYRLCPKAVFLRGNSTKYSAISRKLQKIFYDFTPDIEPISIDEAFLDISGCYHFYQTPLKLGKALRERIQTDLQLAASVGIAPVKMVAKIASDFCKPDGILEIGEEGVQEFLNPLGVGRLWGVGPKAQFALALQGIKTVGQLAQVSQKDLKKLFGEHGSHLFNLSRGIDPRVVKKDDSIRSVSHEHTFEYDELNFEIVANILLQLSEKVSRRMRKKGLKGKTITVKIRLKSFKTYSRAVTIERPTNLMDIIYKQSKRLLNEFDASGEPIRLIGVRVSHFNSGNFQEDLFESKLEKKSELIHTAMDKIKNRFGEKSIWKGFV